MMLQVSTLCYDHIKAIDVAESNVMNGFIYPMVAPIESIKPFCVYRVSKSVQFSKENIHDVNAEFIIVGDDYAVLCDLADKIETYFESQQDWFYQSTESGVNPDEPSEINISIKYNLKMINQ